MLDIIKVVAHLRTYTTIFKAVSYAGSFEHIEQLQYPKLPALVVWRGGREWEGNQGGGGTLVQHGTEYLNVTVITNTLGQDAQGNAVVMPNYVAELDSMLLNWPANVNESPKGLFSVKDELGKFSEDRYWWTFTYGLEVQQTWRRGWQPRGVPTQTLTQTIVSMNGQTLDASLAISLGNLQS